MERRKEKRTKRRLSCVLLYPGGQRHHGIVLDLSTNGLFVQTTATPLPGTRLEVLFPASEGRGEVRVQAQVARQRRVPPSLVAVGRGGLGLTVIDPPDAFQALLRRFPAGGKGESDGPSKPPEPAGETFRIRIGRTDGPRSRVLSVRCESLKEARRRVLARVGSGWEILEIRRD